MQAHSPKWRLVAATLGLAAWLVATGLMGSMIVTTYSATWERIAAPVGTTPVDKASMILGTGYRGVVVRTGAGDIFDCRSSGCTDLGTVPGLAAAVAGYESGGVYVRTTTGQVYRCEDGACLEAPLPRSGADQGYPCDIYTPVPTPPAPGTAVSAYHLMVCGPDGFAQSDYVLRDDGTLWQYEVSATPLDARNHLCSGGVFVALMWAAGIALFSSFVKRVAGGPAT